jgi:hypothetical protein
MSLKGLSEGLSVNSFDVSYPVFGVLFLQPFFLLSLSHGEIEVGTGLRNVLDRSLVKASVCSLP